MGKKPEEKPVVRLKPSSHQPTKAEMEEGISIPARPEDVARALGQQVRIKRETA